jgi:integrase
MARQELTELVVTKTKPRPGKIYEIWDSRAEGFGVRIMPSGNRSYFLMYRANGKQRRFNLGPAAPGTLKDARERAFAAKALVEQGRDPAEIEKQQKAATVGSVLDDYIEKHVPKLRDAHNTAIMLRRELAPWANRPIVSIGRKDVVLLVEAIIERGGELIDGKKKRMSGGPWAAHHLYRQACHMWSWAVNRSVYEGLEHSPFSTLKPKALIGALTKRDRTLNDAELKAVWLASNEVGPFGAVIKALILTGARRDEITKLQWSEVDLAETPPRLVIGPERIKGKKPFILPLSDAMVALLMALPREGRYVFTATKGREPFRGYSTAREVLDKTLRRLDAPASLFSQRWTFHDLRRSFRTRLSMLGIIDTVAELCIGHAKRGMDAVYNQYSYLTEKHEAAQRFAVALMAIIDPPPPNVVTFSKAQAKAQ